MKRKLVQVIVILSIVVLATSALHVAAQTDGERYMPTACTNSHSVGEYHAEILQDGSLGITSPDLGENMGVFDPPPSATYYCVVWSPYAEYLAATVHDGEGNLWIEILANFSKYQPPQQTAFPLGTKYPTWSPNGELWFTTSEGLVIQTTMKNSAPLEDALVQFALDVEVYFVIHSGSQTFLSLGQDGLYAIGVHDLNTNDLITLDIGEYPAILLEYADGIVSFRYGKNAEELCQFEPADPKEPVCTNINSLSPESTQEPSM